MLTLAETAFGIVLAGAAWVTLKWHQAVSWHLHAESAVRLGNNSDVRAKNWRPGGTRNGDGSSSIRTGGVVAANSTSS